MIMSLTVSVSNSSKFLYFRIYFYILMCLKIAWNHQLLLFSKYSMYQWPPKRASPRATKIQASVLIFLFCFPSLN